MKKLLILIILLLYPTLAFAQYIATPNIGLKKPTPGYPALPYTDPNNYGVLINGNFDTIDALTNGGRFTSPNLVNPAFSGTSSGNISGASIVAPSLSTTGTTTTNDLVTKGPWVDVRAFATGGNGQAATPWTGWETGTANAALAYQAKSLGGGGGGITIFLPSGVFATSTGFTIDAGSGQTSISMRGTGYGSAIQYTGTGGTAVLFKNNNVAYIGDFAISNAGSGTTNGLWLQTRTAGSNSTQLNVATVWISGFTNNYHIGSSSDNAADSILSTNLTLRSGTNGVLIEGINSIGLRFLSVNGALNTNFFNLSTTTSSDNNQISIDGVSLSNNTTDFALNAPAFISIKNIHSEGSTTGWSFIKTASSPVSAPPMFLSVENFNNNNSVGVNSIIAWAGSYSFRNVDLAGAGVTVGDTANQNQYQIESYGRDVPISYAAGGHSWILAYHFPSNINNQNNQSVQNMSLDRYDNNGVKTTLYSYKWTNPADTMLKFDAGLTTPGQYLSTLATGTPAFITTSVTANSINATPITYDGSGNQKVGQFLNWGTGSLVNGSLPVAFTTSSVYSASTAYVGFANTQGSNVTKPPSIVQTSGSSMTIYGLFNELVNWWTVGK